MIFVYFHLIEKLKCIILIVLEFIYARNIYTRTSMLFHCTVHTHRHAETSVLTWVFCALNSMTFISGGSSRSWRFGVCSAFDTWCLSTECLVEVCGTERAWWQSCVWELARWTFCCNKQWKCSTEIMTRKVSFLGWTSCLLILIQLQTIENYVSTTLKWETVLQNKIFKSR